MAVKQIFNTSAELDFPNVLPTLDLDFANSKTLDPRITFTRASGGSYVGADGLIKYSGVNEARFDHDPETGESLGLLIEESRVNRTTSSNYSIVSLSLVIINTSVQDVAPDGSTLSAFQATDDTSGTHRINLSNGNTGNATVPHTASFFIKIPDNQPTTSVLIRIIVRWRSSSGSGAGALIFYDRITKKYSTATINTFGSNPPTNYNHTQISFIDYPNGWKRVTIPNVVASSDSATTYGSYDWNISSDATEFVGNCIVFLWGAQLEQGAFPTSYIPTQGSTRTRAVDNAQITGRNFSEWYRPDEGSIYSNISVNDNIPFSRNGIFYSLNDGGLSNRITLFASTSSASLVGRYSVSDVLVSPILTSLTSPKNIKTTFSFQSSNIILLDNHRTSNLFPSGYPTVNTLELGKQIDSQYLNGTISRLTYFPKRLPNSQLQALTS
jgi:hypothetical protein